MAQTTSALRSRMSTESANNLGQPWGETETAIELLLAAQASSGAGTVADNGVSVDKPKVVGGVAQNPSTYVPGYTAGDVAQLAVDKDSGGLLVSDRKKTRSDDAISADPKQYSTVSTATPATADATVFTLAAGEKGFIQNLSADAPLAYKLGASASTSSFNGILNCGSVADDGKGANVIVDDFIGAVSVAKISGTARYIAYKLS
jgi:hypothetical protein